MTIIELAFKLACQRLAAMEGMHGEGGMTEQEWRSWLLLRAANESKGA